jgi:hypothetical protein
MNVKELFLKYKADFDTIWDCLYSEYYLEDVKNDVSISSIYDDFELFWVQMTGRNSIKEVPHQKAKYIYILKGEDDEGTKYYDVLCTGKLRKLGTTLNHLKTREILYLEIILSNYYQYRPENFIAHLLYDMTFSGFDVK